MNKVKSPLTQSEDVSLEETIETKFIIEKYRETFKIETARFFDGIDKISVYKCNKTKFRFYHPFHLAGDGRFYEELQNLPWYYPTWKWEHEISKNIIIKKNFKDILEIGCANGSFIEAIQSLDKYIKCTGLELNEKAVELANTKGLRVLNESIQQHEKKLQKGYDLVCSFQVMEHISEIHEVINASLGVLKIGGLLIVSVPNNSSFLGYDKLNVLNAPPHHMGKWDEVSLKNLQNIFPIKLEKIFLEPLSEQLKIYRSSILFNIHYEKFEKRKKKLGMVGRLLNKLEYLLIPFKYPTFDNMTIIALYRKLC
jgi:2-polyprenyl-3-methyl-5-hydroxy-6-metoxy-1,4-benzoquinol methylase